MSGTESSLNPIIYSDSTTGNKIVTTMKVKKNADGSTTTATGTINGYGSDHPTHSTVFSTYYPNGSSRFIFSLEPKANLLPDFERDNQSTESQIKNQDGSVTRLTSNFKRNPDGSFTKQTTNIVHFPDGSYKIKDHRRHEGPVEITSRPFKPNELYPSDIVKQSTTKPEVKVVGDDWIETSIKHKFNNDGSLTQRILEKTLKPDGKRYTKVKEITYFK